MLVRADGYMTIRKSVKIDVLNFFFTKKKRRRGSVKIDQTRLFRIALGNDSTLLFF